MGNSYTAVNNLPQLISDVALSAGDTLIFDSNTPGGYTLQGHYTNTTSTNKIAAGTWNVVVLQEQSQLPSLQESVVESQVFPYAQKLDSLITLYNFCGETMFYMTWGRKNGDATYCGTWPPVCTYEGMDSLLQLRYMMMADSNDAEVAPVGAVWNFIRQHYPTIELYDSDESHPSPAGSYAAACTFYCAIFRKDPTLITYNYTLQATDAANIRNSVKAVVFDSLQSWHIGEYVPDAEFSYSSGVANSVNFNNHSVYADSFYWDFGDGNNTTEPNPQHTYANAAVYQVMLIATHCDVHDTVYHDVNTTMTFMMSSMEQEIRVFPNPTSDCFSIVMNQNEEQKQVQIFNTFGEIVFVTAPFLSNTITICPKLKNGIYLIWLTTENQTYTFRVLIHPLQD